MSISSKPKPKPKSKTLKKQTMAEPIQNQEEMRHENNRIERTNLRIGFVNAVLGLLGVVVAMIPGFFALSDVADLRETISDLEKDLFLAQQTIKDTTDEANELRDQVTSLQTNLDEAQSKIDSLNLTGVSQTVDNLQVVASEYLEGYSQAGNATARFEKLEEIVTSYIKIVEKQPRGTNAGTNTPDIWQTRTLNNVEHGDIALQNNVFTLPLKKNFPIRII